MNALLLLDGTPADDATPEWLAQPDLELDRRPARSGSRILLVEDDPVVRSLIERLLLEAGHHVLTAAHGVEGLRLALAGSVDLLVTDVRMPLMDGWELSARLRQRAPDLPVLFVSGYDIELTRDVAGRKGNGAFLRKPFDPEELIRVVARLLRAA